MNNKIEAKSCNCRAYIKEEIGINKEFSKTRNAVRTIGSMALSIAIAFFPKCPFCWAIYMSMFGSIGLAQLPYMSWLLPVMLLLFAIHLFILFKRASRHGYLPFLVSLSGAIIILVVRGFFPDEKWILFIGMILIGSGSLLANFFQKRLPSLPKTNNNY